MNCQNCSKTIDSDSRYCPFCGVTVAREGSPAERTHKNPAFISIRIGRAGDNDYVIDNPYVSSHHCIIEAESANQFSIRDLNSANGVFVNGERIYEGRVKATDILGFGRQVSHSVAEIIAKVKVKLPDSAALPLVTENGKGGKGNHIIRIGRDHDNDIIIKNIKVSRHHARLEKIGQAWQITDTQSANGVFVNGKRVASSLISEKDSVTIGGLPLNLEQLYAKASPNWSAELQIHARDLCFRVGDKTIVDQIQLGLAPGQFVGLIGPSGSGKTTFMMMMNGYLKPSSGEVMINGVSLHQNASAFQGQIGYVPQDDIIHRELTVEESLFFTSKLRLGSQISASEQKDLIARIISSLNLDAARTTLIGSPEKKGISGGQRKRVNMAQELITEPMFYFLDEPTSGLDPRSDKEVMLLLKSLADDGHLVLLTTHKIDALNFSIFSHLIVLCPGGKLAYFGPSSDALSFFGVANPEDIFDILEKYEPEELQKRYRQSRFYPAWADQAPEKTIQNYQPKSQAEGSGSGSDPLGQFLVLCHRNLLIKFRDRFSAAVLLLQAPIIGIFIYLVFQGNDKIQSLFFMLVVAAIWLGCSNSAREIVTEQSILRREHKACLSLDAYLASKICVLAALCILQCLVLAVFAVNTIRIGFGFVPLLLGLSFVSITAMCMGLLLSAMVKTGEAAMALVPLALIPQVILGGLIVPFGALPEGVNIAAGLMLSRWAFELLILLEDKAMLTEAIGFNPQNKATDLILIAIICVVFVISTRFLLSKKMR